MNSVNDIVHSTGLDNLKEGELCIFAGAGISFNSGIPLVEKIKSYIVNKLCEEEQERELMLKSKIPFEMFLEIILNNYHPDDIELNDNIINENENKKEKLLKEAALAIIKLANLGDVLQENKKFFDLFGNSNYLPNANHYFIAKMLESGYVKYAVTTNFDVLIEKAYKEITKRDLKIYFSDTEKENNFQFPCLLKLHGSCENLDSIKTTIEKIASKAAKEHCRGVIDYIFNTGKHSKVMILGYSFSDVFDISPSIEEINNSKKKIIYINHVNIGQKMMASQRNINESQFVFRGFSGHQIECNTDEMISTLWNIYFDGIEVKGLVDEKPNYEIEDIIGKWANQLTEPHHKYFICGLLLAFVSRLYNAKEYFIKCLSTDEAKKNNPFKIAVLQNLLSVDPIESSDKRFELDELLKSAGSKEKIKNLINTVQDKLLKMDYEGAETNCREALEMAIGIKDRLQEGLCYASLTHVLNDRKKYENAVESGEKALALLEDANDFDMIKTHCRIYCYLITSYDNLGMEEKKQEYYNKALSLAKKMNIENEMAVLYFSLANSVDIDKNKKINLRKSINYYRLGYDFCKDKDSIAPMIKDSSTLLLAANIVMLYQEDNTLVSEDELILAYELIKCLITNGSLEKYGSTVTIEAASFMALVCIALKKSIRH